MRAGLLDQRVSLQYKDVARDTNGEEVVTWKTLGTVWAQVDELRGKEWFAAGQLQDTVDVKVTMRHRTDVTRDMRLLWGTTPLDIVAVIAGKKRNAYIELMCIKGARNAS